MTIRALILAAGQGTRLRPLTDDKPKCLVELCGHPLLALQIASLRRAGIEDITVLGGYRADQLKAHGVPVVVNPRFEKTNMVFSLFCAQEHLSGASDLLICYGDIVYEPSIIHALCGSPASIAVAIDMGWRAYWEARFPDPLKDAEVLRLGPADRILEIGAKPKSYAEIEGQYLGLLRLRRDGVSSFGEAWRELNPELRDTTHMTGFLQRLIASGVAVNAVRIDGGWLETDSVDDLRLYEELSRRNALHRFFSMERVLGSAH